MQITQLTDIRDQARTVADNIDQLLNSISGTVVKGRKARTIHPNGAAARTLGTIGVNKRHWSQDPKKRAEVIRKRQLTMARNKRQAKKKSKS